MDSNVSSSFRTLGKLTNLLAEKRAAWHQQLLVASAALFGVLIALQKESSSYLYIRLTFALALVLLAIGILLTALVLYSHVDAVSRSRKAATEEAVNALHEARAMKPVAVRERKGFLICEKISYICFGISVLLLASYSILIAIYQ